jgi:hypothetical protein
MIDVCKELVSVGELERGVGFSSSESLVDRRR